MAEASQLRMSKIRDSQEVSDQGEAVLKFRTQNSEELAQSLMADNADEMR